jgi:hypothetical protein
VPRTAVPNVKQWFATRADRRFGSPRPSSTRPPITTGDNQRHPVDSLSAPVPVQDGSPRPTTTAKPHGIAGCRSLRRGRGSRGCPPCIAAVVLKRVSRRLVGSAAALRAADSARSCHPWRDGPGVTAGASEEGARLPSRLRGGLRLSLPAGLPTSAVFPGACRCGGRCTFDCSAHDLRGRYLASGPDRRHGVGRRSGCPGTSGTL